MKNITIYSTEVKDGLSEKILNNKISFASDITKLKTEPTKNDIFYAVAKAHPNQPDLIHRYSILASVGWNNNDDVFLRDELFNARSSPVDKQVNFMHDELTIIGHMTEAFVLDQSGELINAQSLDDLPEKFDIGVGFVLYKMWEDKTRAELVNKVISEIDSGNWFVSMECMFPAFDYAIVDANGNHKVVARNEQSSFLSKYLRVYGGTGIYKDSHGEHKVGRLLRGLFFSGKGIVDNPANKRSVILNNSINFSSTANLNIREVKMEELDKVKAELANTKAENAKLVIELSEKAKASATKEVEVAKAEKAEVTKSLEAELETTKASLTATTENVTKALAEAKAEKAKAEELAKEVAKLKAESAKAERISKLVKAGVEEAKASEIYTKWASASDEQFADVVALHTKAMDGCDDDSDDDDTSKAAKAANLDKAEKEKAKAGNSSTNDSKTLDFDALVKSFASEMSAIMPKAALANKTTK